MNIRPLFLHDRVLFSSSSFLFCWRLSRVCCFCFLLNGDRTGLKTPNTEQNGRNENDSIMFSGVVHNDSRFLRGFTIILNKVNCEIIIEGLNLSTVVLTEVRVQNV